MRSSHNPNLNGIHITCDMSSLYLYKILLLLVCAYTISMKYLLCVFMCNCVHMLTSNICIVLPKYGSYKITRPGTTILNISRQQHLRFLISELGLPARWLC